MDDDLGGYPYFLGGGDFMKVMGTDVSHGGDNEKTSIFYDESHGRIWRNS